MVFCGFLVGTGGSYDFTPPGPPGQQGCWRIAGTCGGSFGSLVTGGLPQPSVDPLPGPGTRGAFPPR